MRFLVRWLYAGVIAVLLILYMAGVRASKIVLTIASPALNTPATASPASSDPSLTDFWTGKAEWILDVPDTGLPVGESDTIYQGDGQFWSYLHASDQSAGVRDSCGDPVPFPGCVTRWVSTDGGRNFSLPQATCLFDCRTCPCDQQDGIDQQQYPRVTRGPGGGLYMVFEHGASAWISYSPDGITWYPPEIIRGTGIWVSEIAPCGGPMKIGPHPAFVHEAECMAGGPPGIIIDNWVVYLFVGLGQNPGHMGCFAAPLGQPDRFAPCEHIPLFDGSEQYGPLDLLGTAANAYFDFRFTTSAEVIRVDDTFYMAYEGIRGPSSSTLGRDDQFGLGFARSNVIDGRWQKFAGNPVLGGMVDNWGIGHADIVIVDGVTYLYTATPEYVRGRYRLVFK